MATTANLTRPQAACVFFGESINKDNERECEKKLDEIEGVDICYLENEPTEPLLVSRVRIRLFPNRYKQYDRITLSMDAPYQKEWSS